MNRKWFTNEKGVSTFYLLWIMGIMAIVFLITINIAKVFVVGKEASNAVEQAALAGTSLFVKETELAIEAFDLNPASIPSMIHHGGKTIKQLVDEKKLDYQMTGLSSDLAYIHALNDVLPSEAATHPLLKQAIKHRLTSSSFSSNLYSTIQSIIDEGNGNTSDTQILLSNSSWRLEIESTVTFTSITDHNIIPLFKEKVPGKGYGPKLVYLEEVYN